MSITVHRITVGDTLSPLTANLQQKDSTGELASVDLTGLTVKVKGAKDNGDSWITETVTGVTVTDADDGLVRYDFQTADVTSGGLFWLWFVVYSGAEKDTYPADGRGLAIDITPSEP